MPLSQFLMVFPYNFIILILVSFILLAVVIMCYKKDYINKKYLAYFIIAVVIAGYVIHIEASLLSLKQKLNNYELDLNSLKEQNFKSDRVKAVENSVEDIIQSWN